MSAPILVTHPVPCLHRPPRARTERFGHLTGVTPVEVRSFSDAPREITRYRETPIVEAEGKAWIRARAESPEHFLDVNGLRSILECTAAPSTGGLGLLGSLRCYLVRSPLCQYAEDGAVRTGSLVAARAGTIKEGTAERAADAVRAFLDDRIRLHGDGVYLRYERLLFAMPLHVGFMTEFPYFPRQSYGVSPHRGNKGYIGMEMSGAGWREHQAIPESLLGDDDALWFANAMPEKLLAVLSRPGLARHGATDASEEIREFRSMIKPFAHLGQTLSIAGDALLPALRTIHAATERLAALSVTAANRSRLLVYAEDARNYRHAAETMARHVFPRLVAREAPPTVDAEALSQLAP